jgi:prepilin peptidase CpaA
MLDSIASSLPKVQLNLIVPLLIAVAMAWMDMRTNRIPNLLVLGCALAGLGYQLGFFGWTGLADGFLGMGLGFVLLIFFYWKQGLGAGDVKALAALGAWLGPRQTFYLFVYMALSGVLIAGFFLWRRGLLGTKIRQFWGFLVNWILLRPHDSISAPAEPPAAPEEGIPYATALAMGMVILNGARLWGRLYV